MSVIIQRYMDLPKFLSLIQTKSLYLAKMAAFEDALEGGLTVCDYFKTSNTAAIIDAAATGAWPPANEDEAARAARHKHLESVHNEIKGRQFQTPFGSYLRDEAEKVFPACKEWLYVSCWHQSDHECAAMWKLYGRDKNSVCILSTDKRLVASIAVDPSCDMLDIQRVNYIDHINDAFSGNSLDPFIAKSKPYSFEREYRLIAWNSDINLSKCPENDKFGLKLNANLEEMIYKIIVSPYADLWFKDVVEKLCKNAGIKADVEDSVLRMQPISNLYRAMTSWQSRHSSS